MSSMTRRREMCCYDELIGLFVAFLGGGGGRGTKSVKKDCLPSRHVCQVCDFTRSLCRTRHDLGPAVPCSGLEKRGCRPAHNPPHVFSSFLTGKQEGRTSEIPQPKGIQSSWGHKVALTFPPKLTSPRCGVRSHK